MGAYASFFLNSKSSVVQLDTLEISHPSFSKVYYIVRNAAYGMTANLETGAEVFFEYYPLSITPTGSSDDLDQTLQINLGDLGEIIPQEIDRCVAAGTMRTKPVVIYRVYRSDDLSAPIDGPYTYEIGPLGSKDSQSTFQASAPKLNQNTTGEIYRMNRFPMLRGFL